jgi:hypothetical protein
MLYKETVSSDTLELLKTLMHDPLLSDFFLVGGTALSLQIGHRRSIDLDLFTIKDFDENALLGEVEEKYNFFTDFQSKNTLKGQITGVKVDFISHKYPLINPLLVMEDVRMAGIQDIAAMKLNAIAGNGTRLKDFIDIAYISSVITPKQIVEAYQGKYSARNPVMAIKSMVYHNDIDFDETIEMMDNNFSWSIIDKRLHAILDTPEQVFEPIDMNVQRRRRGR